MSSYEFIHTCQIGGDFMIKLAVRSEDQTDKYIKLAEIFILKCKFFFNSLLYLESLFLKIEQKVS